MDITQKVVARCGKKVSERMYFTLETIREWAGRYDGGSSRLALQREEERVDPVPPMMFREAERHYNLSSK